VRRTRQLGPQVAPPQHLHAMVVRPVVRQPDRPHDVHLERIARARRGRRAKAFRVRDALGGPEELSDRPLVECIGREGANRPPPRQRLFQRRRSAHRGRRQRADCRGGATHGISLHRAWIRDATRRRPGQDHAEPDRTSSPDALHVRHASPDTSWHATSQLVRGQYGNRWRAVLKHPTPLAMQAPVTHR